MGLETIESKLDLVKKLRDQTLEFLLRDITLGKPLTEIKISAQKIKDVIYQISRNIATEEFDKKLKDW